MKENARAQLWASGKHQPQTAIRSGVASWTEVHSSLRSLGSRPNTGQTLGGWAMCLPPASQKSKKKTHAAVTIRHTVLKENLTAPEGRHLEACRKTESDTTHTILSIHSQEGRVSGITEIGGREKVR